MEPRTSKKMRPLLERSANPKVDHLHDIAVEQYYVYNVYSTNFRILGIFILNNPVLLGWIQSPHPSYHMKLSTAREAQ